MTPAELAGAVLTAARGAFDAHGLDSSVLPEATGVERPRNPEHGDYASNLAMRVAKRAGNNPRQLAGWIAEGLREVPGVHDVDIAGPGFLNIRLEAAAAGELARTIVTAGESYGRGAALAGQRLSLEFGSADPTGPIHLGAARWAAVGDALSRLLRAVGAEVGTEYHEKDLRDRGALDAALARLREQGSVYESEGAVWLRTSDHGDDKDRPLVRSNGEPTYLMADCARYLDKRDRGFDKVVIMLGADHRGYLGRMRAVAACFGDDPDTTLEILIGQLVNLVRDGRPVRTGKRAGTVVVLADLVDAIGADAARYALARYSVDSPIDLDLDAWARRGQDNPVYYVQYAHARIASLLRNAAELGISRGDGLDPGLLAHEREGDLLKELGEFPGVVSAAAELREPHRVARYLEALAGTYHRFYDACRVLPMGDEPATARTHARLWLMEATRTVLANGLALLGVSAPERM